jgi:PIN domain nuclease of toxin-antitoxin system
MRYLIDTNILVRLKTDTSLISKDVSQIIDDMENRIYISSVSIQEVYMLLQDGRIDVKSWNSPQDIFDTVESELGFMVNYVKKEHLLIFAGLAPVKDHTDPFDRMIIAQALTEKIPVISSDNRFRYYRKQKLDFIFNDK